MFSKGLNFFNNTGNYIISKNKFKVIAKNHGIPKFIIDKIVKDFHKPIISTKDIKVLQNIIFEAIKGLTSNIEIDNAKKPNIIVLYGVNGGGKTTSAFKMANLLMDNNWQVAIISTDIIKIGAYYQFNDLKNILNINAHFKPKDLDINDFIKYELDKSQTNKDDILIIDNPGVVNGNTESFEYIVNVYKSINTKKSSINNILIVDANSSNDIEKQLIFLQSKIKIDYIFISKIAVNTNFWSIIQVAKKFNIKICGLGNGSDIKSIKSSDPHWISEYLFNENFFASIPKL